jgi:isoquinoline 1-oxidoreductase beta subunit
MIAASKSAATVVRKMATRRQHSKKRATILERSYTAPFLAHSPLEPMNFFAHVTAEKAELVGPIQTPEFMEKSASTRLGLPIRKNRYPNDENGWRIWS